MNPLRDVIVSAAVVGWGTLVLVGVIMLFWCSRPSDGGSDEPVDNQ